MDWDFTLLTSSRSDPDQLYGLRRNLYFPSYKLYYLVILGDLVLRFTWLTKFTSLAFPNQEGGIFILSFLEVFRRWVWIFFRVEAEWGMFFLFPRIYQLIIVLIMLLQTVIIVLLVMMIVSFSEKSRHRIGHELNSAISIDC